LSEYGIREIESIKMYPVERIYTKKNIPEYQKVSHTKFKSFLYNKNAITRLNTSMDTVSYKDEYDNCIAYVNLYGTETYYINPDLYALGQEKKSKIEDEYYE
jgi:hypothetical protein